MSRYAPIRLTQNSGGGETLVQFVEGPRPYIRLEDSKGKYLGSFEDRDLTRLSAWVDKCLEAEKRLGKERA